MSTAEQKAVLNDDMVKLAEARMMRRKKEEKELKRVGQGGNLGATNTLDNVTSNTSKVASEALKATAYWKLKMTQASKYLRKK